MSTPTHDTVMAAFIEQLLRVARSAQAFTAQPMQGLDPIADRLLAQLCCDLDELTARRGALAEAVDERRRTA